MGSVPQGGVLAIHSGDTMIAYAAVVWWPRVIYSTVAKQLEHIQRLACLYITGA